MLKQLSSLDRNTFSTKMAFAPISKLSEKLISLSSDNFSI